MLRTTITLLALTLGVGLTASADFSYSSTQKVTGGTMAAMAGTAADRTSQYAFKDQKMVVNTGNASVIIDFGAKTVTTLNNAAKTYTVKKFSDLSGAGPGVDVTADVKDTGQKKVIDGFNASETIITMNMDMDAGRGGPAMKMQLEMDLWVSPDVPGASELRAFYRKNAADFPWSAMMAGGGNPSMQKAVAEMQRKLADLNGVVVEQVIRMKPAGGAQAGMPQMPQMNGAQVAQMQAAMARMEEMAKQGGPAGAAAQQAMERMGNMTGGGAAASGAGGALIEMTMNSSGFSTASVPDSDFAIPAGYKEIQ